MSSGKKSTSNDGPSSSKREQTDATKMQGEELVKPTENAVLTRKQESDENSRIIKREESKVDCPDVVAVAFLADGEHFVSSDSQGRIRRWEVINRTEVGTAMHAGSFVRSIAVSRDGKWIVSGTQKGEVAMWNAESHEKVSVFEGHAKAVYAVNISPDGTKVASGADDCTVSVWSRSSGTRLLGPLLHRNDVVAVKFSPDGRFMATATWKYNSVRIYDSQDGRLIVDFPINVSSIYNESLAWCSDKELFALSYEGSIHHLDVSSQTTLAQWPIHGANYYCYLSLANNGAFIAVSNDSSVSFWDTATHNRIGSVIHHPGSVSSLAIWDNQDLLTAGGSKIVFQDLLDILPLPYRDETFEIHRRRTEARVKKTIESCEHLGVPINTLIPILEKATQELRVQFPDAESMIKQQEDGANETIRSLRAENANSYDKIANLEQIAQELRDKLARSQHEADAFVEKLVDTQRKADTLLYAYRRKHRCETLYADGHVIDGARILLGTEGTANDDAKSDRLIIDWTFEFTNKCISQLEKIGEEASQINDHDEALAAYSTALSLGSSTSSDLLIKWARISLLRGSTNDALNVATKFKVPRLLVYRVICDVLEEGDRIQEALDCFRQMQNELASDISVQDERARWELGFQRRCTQKLQQLSDFAMNSRNYKEAVDHLTTILSLDQTDRVETLIERSKARVMIGLWEGALTDADEVIRLDASYRGYELRHSALQGAGRYAEAVQALDTMFSKLTQSPEGRELRSIHIDARPEIRRAIHATVSHMPRVLIDTTTGLLHERTQLAAEFEGHPIFPELVSSMTTELDDTRVWEEVEKFYRYAMFSHKWELDEPLLQDVEHLSVYELKPSRANVKLQTFCLTARSHGCRWAWSDTCCVDKVNNVVLQESLVAMFSWYRGSFITLVHLLDVWSNSNEVDLKESIWNTRAWTYQEYMAAERVAFYTADWKPYLGLTVSNHKESPIIVSEMEQVSRVSQKQLSVLRPGLNRVREKLFLASMRQSTLVEDIAYSLLGIFNVTIPVIYGEQHRAVGRLLEHILTGSRDLTILAWTGTANTYNSCLPMDLTVYDQLEPPHIPRAEVTQVDQQVTELRSSTPDLSLVMKLYDQVMMLPPPFLASSRLELPGIIIPVNKVVRESGPNPRTKMYVYRATTIVFGDVEIKTTNNLTAMDDLHLVHPWIRPLLDQEFSLGSGVRRDRTTRALRLVARLMQPFGALLFEQVSRVDYRRVAADSLIMAQICKDVSLDYLIQNIDKIDVQ